MEALEQAALVELRSIVGYDDVSRAEIERLPDFRFEETGTSSGSTDRSVFPNQRMKPS
jgi:hypothetical protein